MDLTTVEKNLKERGFKVSSFATAKAAADYLNAQIDGESVSFGGSMTLSQMGLFESLGAHNAIYSHWNVPDGMNAAEVFKNASTCDNYLLSANGLAETGEIINIDGTGNRVSSSLFGHKKVWFIVGSNKIAPTYDEALWRARNIAAPKNAQRLGVKRYGGRFAHRGLLVGERVVEEDQVPLLHGDVSVSYTHLTLPTNSRV